MSENNTVSRNNRKVLTGTVISRTGDKTIKVAYSYKIPHPMYKKEIKRKTVIHVHDGDNKCKLGDSVEVVETRPLSKLKRWRLSRIINSAAETRG
ncbi:MAG: 30S ribosomal protein S17 [Puniceicoccales bacterium]|jgi:small subunit ribosomal protein S17|nr:30S ribosomal protein S17 [Puniceicoccales bacterium]